MIANRTSSDEEAENMFGTGDERVLLAAVVEIILCTVGSLGNLLTCLAVIKKKGLHLATNYFIASLAAADFLVSTILVPMRATQHLTIYSGHGHVPKAYVELAGFVGRVNILASICNLAALSVDRWVALAHPMRYHTSLRYQTGKVMAIIACIWLFAILFTSLPKFPGVDDTAFLVGFVVFVLLITVLIIAAYYRIFRIARKLSRRNKSPNVRLSDFDNSAKEAEDAPPKECQDGKGECYGLENVAIEIDEVNRKDKESGKREEQSAKNANLTSNARNKLPRSSPESSRQERKTAKTIALVIFAFILLVYPRIILIIYHMVNEETHASKLARFWIRILLYSNSSVNPILYSWRNRDYRNQYIQIIKICTCFEFWKRQKKLLVDWYTVSSVQDDTQNTTVG